MAIAIEERFAVSKKKGVSVQIDEDVVKTARIVAALIDKPISTLISEILQPVLARMESEELAKRGRPSPSKPRRLSGGD